MGSSIGLWVFRESSVKLYLKFYDDEQRQEETGPSRGLQPSPLIPEKECALQ